MSENPTPRRRRRPTAETQQTPQEPLRIIVSGEDEPDWMVSAGSVSGAASRRVKSAAPGARKTAEDTEKKCAPSAAGQTKAKAQPSRAKSSAASARSKAAAPRRTPRKLTKKEIARRKMRTWRTLIGALIAIAATALIILAVTGVGRLVDIKQTLDRGDGVFYPNLYVNNIPLEGKTLDEAASAVTQQVASMLSAWKITLKTQDGRSWDITAQDLNMQYDVADQLDQLWAIGHTGSSSARYEQVMAVQKVPVMRYTTLTYDMSMVTQILAQIKDEVDRPAVSATRVNDETKWPPYSYTDEIPGVELDITGLNERICGLVDRIESGVVDLTPTVVEAPVTREQLEGQIVLLSTFETSIGKTGDYVQERHENIRIGTEKFDRKVIRPDEVVSFNKVTGKRKDPRNGYQKGLEIAYGEYVEGLGGGICQVSSTLYNAVVNAGLLVTERTAHALKSSYVPMGLDATVSDDRYDLKFKNTTGADIYISSEYYQKKNNYWQCKFSIYGRPDPNGYTYKLESEVAQTLAIPDPQYKDDKDGQYVIYVDDEPYLKTKGAEGYVVDVYLVTMDANGLEVSRELQYTDTYKPITPVYYVGVTPRETPSPEVWPAID